MQISHREQHLLRDGSQLRLRQRSASCDQMVERSSIHVLERHGDLPLAEARADESNHVLTATCEKSAKLLQELTTLSLVKYRHALECDDAERRQEDCLVHGAICTASDLPNSHEIAQFHFDAESAGMTRQLEARTEVGLKCLFRQQRGWASQAVQTGRARQTLQQIIVQHGADAVTTSGEQRRREARRRQRQGMKMRRGDRSSCTLLLVAHRLNERQTLTVQRRR